MPQESNAAGHSRKNDFGAGDGESPPAKQRRMESENAQPKSAPPSEELIVVEPSVSTPAAKIVRGPEKPAPSRNSLAVPSTANETSRGRSPTTPQEITTPAYSRISDEEVSDGEDLMVLYDGRAQETEENGDVVINTSTGDVQALANDVEIIPEEPQPVANGTSKEHQNIHMNGHAENEMSFDWEHMFGVSPVNRLTEVYKQIAEYRIRHARRFNSFNKSIWDHMMNNLQNDATFAWKMCIRQELWNELTKHYPKCILIAVGSSINGCGAYNCDMDLCLCLECPENRYETDRRYALRNLKKCQKSLTKVPVVKRVELIPAKVPILKLWFNQPYEQLEVDLNVNNMPGIYNSYLLHYYSRIDDKFPALCLIVKHWARRAEIADASLGTFNSYSLILMVLHFLQVASDPPVLPNLQALYPDYFSYDNNLEEFELFANLPSKLPDAPRNTKKVGELLIAFFDYYTSFDYDNWAISIERGCIFPRTELPENTRRFKVFIEEPFDGQNTARCITSDEQWDIIMEAFNEARSCFFGPRSNDPPSLQMLQIPVTHGPVAS